MARVHVLDVIRDVSQRCKGCPNGTLVAAYIRAARSLLRESRWYRSNLTAATTAGARAYSLGSDPYDEVIGIQAMAATDANGNQRPVFVGLPSSWPLNATDGQPRHFAYVPEGQFALFPTPDAIYPLLITLVLIPKSGQNTIEESVLAKWDTAIQAGALDYLLRLNEPWKDAGEADRQQRAFRAGVNNAKAEAQSGYQFGSRRALPRPFFF